MDRYLKEKHPGHAFVNMPKICKFTLVKSRCQNSLNKQKISWLVLLVHQV